MDLLPLVPKAAASIRLARSSRIAVWEGAVGSGKSTVANLAMADAITRAPQNGAVIASGKTLDTLHRNVLQPMADVLGAKHVRHTRGATTATVMGRTVHLLSHNDESSEHRLRGVTASLALVDEVTLAPRSFWDMLLSRMRVEGARILATTNPAGPKHWLLEDYLARACLTIGTDGTVTRNHTHDAIGVHRYRFLMDDNPGLPADYVASMRSAYTGLFYRRFVEGEWVAATGAVYPMLDVSSGSVHVANWRELAPNGTPPAWSQVTVGVDHGMTNPTHAVVLGTLPDGRVVAIGEHVQTSGIASVGQQAERLERWLLDGAPGPDGLPAIPKPATLQGLRMTVDPAAKAFRVEWKQRGHGWPWEADNRVLIGVQRVGTLLEQGRLLLVPHRVPVLVRELSGYVWDERQQERGVDAPVKADDHGPDALRYAVMAASPPR